VLAALCAVALELAACGGSGLSRSDLAKQANAICVRTSAALHRSRRLGSSGQARALALADAAAARQRELNALRKLQPSPALSQPFYRYIANEANVIAGLTTAKVRARAGHLASAQAVLEFAAGSRGRMRAAARRLGWRDCRMDV
jgi:hypothetical protein